MNKLKGISIDRMTELLGSHKALLLMIIVQAKRDIANTKLSQVDRVSAQDFLSNKTGRLAEICELIGVNVANVLAWHNNTL